MYHEFTVVASAARTTSSNSAVLDTLQGSVEGAVDKESWFFLNVSAVSGTNPTLDVKVTTIIGALEFDLTPVFAQKTGISKEAIKITNCPRFIKVSWTIGGTATPTFTFSVALAR